MKEKSIEQAIQAAGKTAPRITPVDIDDVIIHEYYFTAANGVHGAYRENNDVYIGTVPTFGSEGLRLLTFCVLVLKNGFTVTGESACASPENFDAEIGRNIARENARNKIWALEGYLLKQKLTDQRKEMIQYIHEAMREGYEPMFQISFSDLNYEDLKIEHGRAWEYYNLAADEKGRHPRRDLGE